MKHLKRILAFAAAALAIVSCYDDSALESRLDALDAKVAALQSAVDKINSDISSLQTMVLALQNNVNVTDVIKREDGYVITFSNGTSASISNGKDGTDGTDGKDAPIVGIQLDSDGLYYWTLTVDGITSWLTDINGNKMPVCGKDGADGHTPVIVIGENGNWFIDGVDTGISSHGKDGTDGETPTVEIGENGNWFINGEDTGMPSRGANGTNGTNGKNGKDGKDGTTPQISVDADGYWCVDGQRIKDANGDYVKASASSAEVDTIFKSVDVSDPYCVTFTLTSGSTFTLPKAVNIKIGDDSGNGTVTINAATTFALKLPEGLKEADYQAITATIVSESGVGTAIVTKASYSTWTVGLTQPNFKNGTYNGGASLILTPNPIDPVVKVDVSLILNDGKVYTTSRVFKTELISSKAEIVCVYNVTTTATETSLLYNSASYYDIEFSSMSIDGTDVAFNKKYSFLSAGEHTVTFYVSNNGSFTSLERLFYGIKNLISFKTSAGFNTTKVTSMDHMFFNCEKATSIDVSRLNTANATKINGVFSSCKVLPSLDIRNFNTGKAGTMGQMFTKCAKLTDIWVGSATNSARILADSFDEMSSSGILHYPSGSDYSLWLNYMSSGWTGKAY
ncbi:MAG: BspA family leucine-rich repeat surface protein [Bacteroidales bacterium]|nr:BspA family leucine-rich repeat surface protein [Bacteroidales bacterium]